MNVTEFKELYDDHAVFDVERDVEKREVHVYLCWSCERNVFLERIYGNNAITVELADYNYDRGEVKVEVFFGDTLISKETLLVPDNAPAMETLH